MTKYVPDAVKRIAEMEIAGANPETLTVVDAGGWAWRKDMESGEWSEVDDAWDKNSHGYPHILAITPFHPAYGVRAQTWDSIRAAIEKYEGPIDWVVSGGDNPHNLNYENVTHQHNKGRRMALAGDYDAMLSIEADMIVPDDVIQRLIALGADIAYGLYVWRHKTTKNRWSAYKDLRLWGGTSVSLDYTGKDARAAWGQAIDVAGVGMGCTLIKRRVLEKIEFRLYEGDPDDWLIEEAIKGAERAGVEINPYQRHPSMLADDWLLALDAQHYGFTQRCDLSLVCGHINGGDVLWPDPEAPELYRRESLTMPGGEAGRGE